MEPLGPAKNDEGSGFSSRRISSILKVPRKSTIFPIPEQQENVVECPKSVEKRNSRRVSFAPADDVLLFSNHVNKASPTRSPLRDLMTTATATNNRVQVGLTDDGIQQIAGMETLLNAPLHASQHRDEVNFAIGGDFGEKTLVFSTDDAFMDMTHCQTINIDSDKKALADVSLQNCDILPTRGGKTAIVTAGDGSMDLPQSQSANIVSGTVSPLTSTSVDSSAKTNSVNSSSGPYLIPDFDNFLKILFKSSVPSVNPGTTNMMLPAGASSEETNGSSAHIKTQRADVDKENQAPTSLPAVTEKPVSTLGKIGDSSSGCAFYPKDDESMDMTESQTGCIRGFTEDDPPFQSPFHTQDTSSHLDNRGSQKGEETAQQQGSKTLASFNTKDLISSKNPPLHAPQQRQMVNFDTKDECREKTMMFTAGDEFVDMTRSHIVKISCGSSAPAAQIRTCSTMDDASSLQDRRRETCGPPSSSSNGLEPGFNNFLASVFKTSAPCGNPEMARVVPPAAASQQELVDTNSFMSQRKRVVGKDSRSLNTTICPANDVSMEMTEAQTGLGSSDDASLFSHPTQDTYPRCESLKSAEMASGEGNSRAPGPFNSAGLETSLKPSLKTNVRTHQKTVRFDATEACMDVTQSHSVNIAADLKLHSHQNMDSMPACGEKTVRFDAMDVTQSHSVNIATDLDAPSHQSLDFSPSRREEAAESSANDAAVDVMESRPVNAASDSMAVAGLPDGDSNIPSSRENLDFTFPLKRRGSETRYLRRNQSSSARTLDPDYNITLSKTPGPWANAAISQAAAAAAPRETLDTSGFMDQPKRQEPDVDTANGAPGYVSAVTGNPVNNTMVDCQEDNVRTAMTEAPTDQLLGQTHTDVPPLFSSSTLGLCVNSDHLEKTEGTLQQSNVALETFGREGAEITSHTDYLDSYEADDGKEPERGDQTSSPNVGDNVDAAPSRKSRRGSLANLHSKIRRLSHMISTAPDAVATESCTAPLPPLEGADDESAKDTTKSLPVTEPPEPDVGFESTEANAEARCLMGGEEPRAAPVTPFNLKTVQLISRLSFGGFKAKLPERSKPDNSKKASSAGEQTRTVAVDVTRQQSNVDGDVSDIFDEELASCEDESEVLDVSSPGKAPGETSPPLEFDVDGPLENDVFEEGLGSAVRGKERPLPEDENHTEDEKRMEASTETATDVGTGSQPHLADSSAPCGTTQSTEDPNSGQSASMRCEAMSKSTFKQSLFESHLEDYASDVTMKFEDSAITVLEFFKLFNVDFIIHNPRQSVLPENIISDTALTPMDLLKDRHINHPKQLVYERDVLALTEQVERLKHRTWDLKKPLRIVNKPLWEDLGNSSEKELKSFGAKLKERNNLFRKTSKVLWHEMKEVLYSNLVQANLEEQQTLRGTIEEADEMLKSLDDCIHGIEAELAAVEEKGFEDKPSLRSLQEETKKVNEALADNDRKITELEMQKNLNIKKINRLRAETKKLDGNIDTLHLLSEWKFGENGDKCTVYTFLHDTFDLQLAYEESNGDDVDNQSERKITQITFKHRFDAEESQDHARLVHRLLAQYVEGEAAWVEKYPTSRYVPKLLQDVGLVVGRCRLLGEELRLLKMWGGLRLDVLSVSFVDSQVHIVFSSLKKCSKFEVILSVRLTSDFCVLQVDSFKNVFGSTTIQQIEEIVASFSPGRNTLTKIVKKIHENLLC